MNDFWIILTGSLVAINCALLGTFLVLRKMAMVGDAISHAVLPGIVIAFLMTGSRNSELMLLAATLTGVLTTVIIQFLNQTGKLQADASIGVTFTLLFAIGIILISVFAGKVDLDQECVLYGEIAYVPLDLWITASGNIMGPRPVFMLLVVLLLNILFIVFGYKELFSTSFDPLYASAIGISVSFWQYALMSMVSVTTVTSFESVGAILVIAFLIAPPATAYLLTENLTVMLVLSALIGVLSAIGGYYLAYAMNGSIAGAMATVAGVLFALAFFFSPKEGLVFKKRHKTQLDEAEIMNQEVS